MQGNSYVKTAIFARNSWRNSSISDASVMPLVNAMLVTHGPIIVNRSVECNDAGQLKNLLDELHSQKSLHDAIVDKFMDKGNRSNVLLCK